MAKKTRATFFCGSCGHEEPRWFGRCPSCQAWNTASEAPSAATATSAAGRRRRWTPPGAEAPAPRALASVEVAETPREVTGIPELDRVLGGGLVPGSLILVGGDPGIGKSTLVLQVARALSSREHKVLYVAGEESEEQVRMRAQRLGETPESLFILCETDLEAVIDAANAMRPDVLVADSIQTLSRSDLDGGPGSVTQVRECGLALLQFAKATRTVVFLIGHVTKEGAVAGPRVL
jgi:DNA repair protein RadA/Sms